MLLGEIVKVALEALRANKLRSLLTMLGIIIGVGAVITMIALGSGAQKSVQDRIQALGPTLLSLYPGQSFMRGVASGNRVSLTMDDDTALANNARYVSAVVPELSNNLQVQKGDQNINANVVGTTPNYVTVHNYTIMAGRMHTAVDGAARGRARRGEPARRRPRDHEHHARVGHRAHARDRRPQSARGNAVQHPVPVPGRSAGVVPAGRHDRRDPRLGRRHRAVAPRALEYADFPARHPPRLRVQRRGGAVLRHLAGPPGGEPRSDCRAEIRIVGGSDRCAVGGARLLTIRSQHLGRPATSG